MRILCIDYGKKRCGLAVTDALHIIASSLGMVETKDLMSYLRSYIKQEPVGRVLIGYPLNLDGSPTHATPLVDGFMRAFRNAFPALPIEPVDERYSSAEASREIAGMGLKKSERQRKGLIDEVAAVLLLREWLQSH